MDNKILTEIEENMIAVSVILITYNQEKFICNALDSILMQNTTFKIEILVGEDCSTDNTARILKSYEEIFPNKLKVIYNKKNVGASQNLFNLLTMARGKYIAMLEGDDYWLNENRLQILYDYLEANDYVAVTHRRERRTQEGILVGMDPDEGLVLKEISLRDYHNGKLFSVMGCMFKNLFLNSSRSYERAMTMARNACDNVIAHIILSNGNVYVMDECLGVYRVLMGTDNCSYCANTKQDKVDLDAIKQYRGIRSILEDDVFFKQQIAYRIFDAMLFLLKRKKNADMLSFWSEIQDEEKKWFYRYFFSNVMKRLNLHLRINR